MITTPRHTVLVRITHWITAASVAGLLVSGVAILLAHPRLYWGETGAVGGPSLIDLPLPFVLTGQSGWGRSLHFLSAWIIVICGLVYVAAGIRAGHFRGRLFSNSGLYNTAQRRTYAAVVFVLFPVLIWTGLAMSPAIVSVAPVLVTTLGGQQTARTIHFVAAAALVVFIVGHVVMVWLNGPMTLIVEMVAPRKAAPYAGGLRR
jgi:thiosulfate reductase cytochrome b subunit